MVKTDYSGWLRLCYLPLLALACCLWFLSLVGESIGRFWMQGDIGYNLFDSICALSLLAGASFCISRLVCAHKKWLRLEHARNKSDDFPIYEMWGLYRSLAVETDSKPPALKRMMARRDVVRMIQALCGCFFVFCLIGFIIAFIVVARSGHYDRLFSVVLFAIASFVGMVLSQSPIVFLIIFFRYERVEANERGVCVQRGLFRRFIAWEDAHLFAMRGTIPFHVEEFELTGSRAIVRLPFISPGVGAGPGNVCFARKSPGMPYQPVSPGLYRSYIWHVVLYVQRQTDLPLRDLRME